LLQPTPLLGGAGLEGRPPGLQGAERLTAFAAASQPAGCAEVSSGTLAVYHLIYLVHLLGVPNKFIRCIYPRVVAYIVLRTGH